MIKQVTLLMILLAVSASAYNAGDWHFYSQNQVGGIYYDVMYLNSTQNPILVLSDSFSNQSTREDIRGVSEWFSKYGGFFVVNVDTRGKGESSGVHDLNGYECRDLINAALAAYEGYSDYIDPSKIYIGGISGGGARAMTCIGKYPDYYTSAFSIFGISNYTAWYAETDDYRQKTMELWLHDTPKTDKETYESRGGLTLANNIITPIMVLYNENDPYVLPHQNTDFVDKVKSATPVSIDAPHDYTITDDVLLRITDYLKTHESPKQIPREGTMTIAGYLVTKDFSIEIASVDEVGTVDYKIIDQKYYQFTMDLDMRSVITFNELEPNTKYQLIDGQNNVTLFSSAGGKLGLFRNEGNGTIILKLPDFSLSEPKVEEKPKRSYEFLFILIGLGLFILAVYILFQKYDDIKPN